MGIPLWNNVLLRIDVLVHTLGEIVDALRNCREVGL